MRTKIAGHYLSLLALTVFLTGFPSLKARPTDGFYCHPSVQIGKKLMSTFFPLLHGFPGSFLEGSQEQNPKPLEQYLEIELKRVEETYRLLELFAQEIWPGWDNYHEAGFRIYFPNRVIMLVNPRKPVPAGYELLQGRTAGSKPIYLHRQEQLPLEMKLPLTGAGGGGLTVKVRLSQPGTPTSRSESELGANSDNQILMYVHEIFHGFQEKFGFMPEGDAILNFMSNTGFATYAHIEGLALLQAYRETDQDKALEYLQDYLVAHECRQAFMTPEMIADEPVILTQEGTATYAEINMAMAIRDKKYTPGIRPQDDPFFFHFQAIDAYIETYTTKSLRKEMADTLDTFGRCYPFGAYQCFLLDRFMPGWKRDFFKSKKTLTELITHLLHLSPEQKQTIAQGLKTKYPYEEIYARHDAVIKERDDAVQRVKNRKGTKYILDLVNIREWFQLKARQKEIFLKGIEKIYPHGVETFQLGDIRLTTPDTPLSQTWLHTYEWIAAEPEKGDKDKEYQMTFEKKDGDTYKNLVFRTGGFTLNAPETQIKEDKEKNEIRIVVLSHIAH